MGNKEKHTSDTYTCPECGMDLYDENNLILELKSAMDYHLNVTDANIVGRPLYVISIGDSGYEMTLSEINPNDKVMDDFLISCLKNMIKSVKKEKRHKKY